MLKGVNIYFLSIRWITFFKHLYSSMCCNGMQRAWLCKHNKEVRSIQASISRNSCTELSKTQLFPVIIVNQGVCQKVRYFEPHLPSCHTFSFFFFFLKFFNVIYFLKSSHACVTHSKVTNFCIYGGWSISNIILKEVEKVKVIGLAYMRTHLYK